MHIASASVDAPAMSVRELFEEGYAAALRSEPFSLSFNPAGDVVLITGPESVQDLQHVRLELGA